MAIGEQIALAGLMILTSKGAAGITGAGLVTLTASLQAFGGTLFSAEAIAVGIALVVGIDRIMSEGRALTNAIGNSVATLAIARWQGELDRDRLHTVLDRPEIVDRDVEAALRGADTADDQDRPAASSATWAPGRTSSGSAATPTGARSIGPGRPRGPWKWGCRRSVNRTSRSW